MSRESTKFLRGNRFWLALSLALMLLSGLVAWLVQTGVGAVAVKDMRWETRSGEMISALLFKPATATAGMPAPAIVVGHGWWNSREMQNAACLELARRGYVVVSVDLYGHGNSDYLQNDKIEIGGTGLYDAVRLAAELPYVDRGRVGISGHSSGARAANFSVEIDNAADKPLISAVLLIDNDPIYTDAAGRYTNIYGYRSVGLVADQYDEFYFRRYSPKGAVLTPPRQYVSTPNAQSFLHFGADPAEIKDQRIAGEFYAESGYVRITYTPWETHPWGIISKTTIADQIAFFGKVLSAPNPIAANSQVWQIKEVFTSIGLIGFCIFLVAFARALLDTPAFAGLKQEAPRELAILSREGRAWFWGGLIVSAIVSGASYVIMSNVHWIQGIAFNRVPTIFTQGAVFFIALWDAINGLAALIIMAVSYLLFWRAGGLDLRAAGVLPGWRKFLHGISLGAVVVATAYGIVFVLDYFLKTDLRVWLIAVRAFTPDKLWIGLRYLPFFVLYFFANSLAVNGFNRFTLLGREWLNMAVLALFNSLAPIVLVVVQYVTFFRTGYTMNGLGGIFGVWLFPVIVNLAVSAIISRKIYQSTRNPYIGGFINAAVVTLIAVTNTLTVVY